MTAIADPHPDAARLTWGERIDRHSGRLMVLPAVIVILCFAVFPLIISAYLAHSRLELAPAGFTLKFVGYLNY
jgi:multiple sugar transport system permease protein